MWIAVETLINNRPKLNFLKKVCVLFMILVGRESFASREMIKKMLVKLYKSLKRFWHCAWRLKDFFSMWMSLKRIIVLILKMVKMIGCELKKLADFFFHL